MKRSGFSILQKKYGHPVAYKILFLSNQKKLYAWRQDNTMPLKHKIFKLCPHIICFSTGFKEMLHVSPQTIPYEITVSAL